MSLGAILELTGRLTDQSGGNTARERFRRFLTSTPSGVAPICSLIDEAQRSDDEQAQRALGDLVASLGRSLGFDVTYGPYGRAPYGARLEAVWHSRTLRCVVDVRIVRDPVIELADAPTPWDGETALDADGPPPIRVRVVVPRHAALRGSRDSAAPPIRFGDVRVLSLSSLVALAEDAEAGCLTAPTTMAAVLGAECYRATEFWIATIVDDEGAAPEQLADAVIRRRRLLPASRIGMFSPSAHPGDWVCFYLSDVGVIGSGRLRARLEQGVAPIRGAERFASIFALADLTIYDAPVPLDPASLAQRLATRAPLGVVGSFLSPIPEPDFRALTGTPSGVAPST